MSSGLPFRVYKDVKIKDMIVEGSEVNEQQHHFTMIEFKPNFSNMPLNEFEFWAKISEDHRNRTFTFELCTNGEVKDEYLIVSFKVLENGHINFNAKPSPLANSKQHYFWYSVMEKIKNIDYRRFYIVDSKKNIILTSSCPTLDSFLLKLDGEIFIELSKTEEKYGGDIIPPNTSSLMLLKEIRELNDGWEQTDPKFNISKLESLKNEFDLQRSTLITFELKLKNTSIIPMIIINHNDWIDYSQLNLKLDTIEQKQIWNSILRNQGAISLGVNARTFTPKECFDRIFSMKSRGMANVLDIVNELLQINSEELPSLKTNIYIEFFEPKDLVQEVKVVLQDIDEDYNIMENHLRKNEYVQAIPYLEKLSVDDPTLSYAYVLDNRYDDALTLAEKVIKVDRGTVAHMTKGLAMIGQRKFKQALEAYKLGVNICSFEWWPTAQENLLKFIANNNITSNREIEEIIDLLDIKRTPLHPKQNCYCGSRKKFKKCHGNF